MGEVWKARDTRVDRLVAINDVPFSHDGQSIYFSSTAKLGPPQLYKMKALGGRATLVAGQNVVRATESADGHWLYFADWERGSLYRMPLAGGEIAHVLDRLTDPAGHELAGQGVYY